MFEAIEPPYLRNAPAPHRIADTLREHYEKHHTKGRQRAVRLGLDLAEHHACLG